MYILASASPRRVELLKKVLVGEDFEVMPTDIDEVVDTSLSPAEVAESLAFQKAQVVARVYPNKVVIGSDTIVVHNNQILGKPDSAADAVKMLENLSGKPHYVITGYCIMKGDRFIVNNDKTIVIMKDLSLDSIKMYVKDFNPLDKAGAYGIQDNVVVETFTGSHANVMGLPIEKLAHDLKVFVQEND